MSARKIEVTNYLGSNQDGGDDRTPLALAAGLAAALVAGALWAALVYLTTMEIGYAAWGVGLLVGLAMMRATQQRSQQLAYAAAAFALVGLLAGKAFNFAASAGPMSKQLVTDSESMTGAIAWQMYRERALDQNTLATVDATLQAGDTLSDAAWTAMTAQAATKLKQMTETERQGQAADLARFLVTRTGLIEGVKNQLSPFDLLWLFLAVGTAYRMMGSAKEETAPEPQVGQPA